MITGPKRLAVGLSIANGLAILCGAAELQAADRPDGEGRTATARLGAAEVSYANDRWTASRRSANRILFTPIRSEGSERPPVELEESLTTSEARDCKAVAERLLDPELYRPAAVTPVRIDARPALRFLGSTRCRNATPNGEVLCVPAAGRFYTLTVRIAGCRDDLIGLFSQADPLAQLIGGLRFREP